MKKKLLLLFLSCLCLLPTAAQNMKDHCYRGIVDTGYSLGIGDYDFGRYEINTIHGYQFNPYFFIGAGTGIHFMSSYKTEGSDVILDQRDSKTDIPVFADIKCNLGNKKLSPFVDIRGGLFVTNSGSLYLNAAIGLRYALNESQGIHLSVGYSKEKLEFETFDHFISDENMDYSTSGRKLDTENISIRLGFEF